jgi:antitoxin PrlF
MIKSKLTSKSQTTIPQAVRTALGLRQGDEIAYQIDGDKVVLRKAPEELIEDDPFALFDEWNSEADREGYADF